MTPLSDYASGEVAAEGEAVTAVGAIDWKVVSRSIEAVRIERDNLRRLLNEARAFIPTDHALQGGVRKALGLIPQSSMNLHQTERA